MATCKYSNWNRGQEEALLNILGGEDVARKILSGEVTVTITPKVIAEDTRSFAVLRGGLYVNYARSVTDSVKAGRYDWENAYINDTNFPSTEIGDREVEYGMFYFGKNMSSDKVIAEMDKAGYRPATMKELLAYGEKHPDEQRKYPIVGLGSVAKLRSNGHVGCLGEDGSERFVDLRYYDDRWYDCYWFLGVRKTSVS